MILYPNAKVNLGLDIVRRRADGYHDISTVFYPINLTDILEVVPAKGDDATLSPPTAATSTALWRKTW